ncbi:MAG: peptidoglycan bridge formation glycyltransferase FemA/FemB family protein [Candidatus Staskawiczbacteria bacterium]|jgi:lipid II:glycine glycyltransferase (peptidoglycan interpeptide bridge formation enzyme)
MEAIFYNEKKEWDDFVLQNNGNFLQSFDWGEFQKKSDVNIFRIRIIEKEETLLQVQVFKESSFSKNYFYIPFGPIFIKNIDDSEKKSAVDTLIKKIQKLAKKEKCIFLRIEPLVSLGSISQYKNNISLRRIQPQKTLLIDLKKTEEELLKEFSSTTRHNIIRARKSGVKIKELNEYSADFYKLLGKTKDRQDFGVYSEDHYKNLFDIKSNVVKFKLFLAQYDSKIINATIVLIFNNRAVTLHSGSDYNYRNVKGTNLLKWEIISSSKKDGLEEIDMWGIDEKKWPNLTAFKKGFGGTELEYPHGVDIVFQSFWYNIYKITRVIRKLT